MQQAHFVLSKSRLLKQYETVRGLVDKVSYSYKTNPTVGALLGKMTDCDFDVDSVKTLDSIKDKRRVWFLALALDDLILSKIFSSGVRSFIIENKTDLGLLLDYSERHGKRISILLRMRMKERTIKTEGHYVYGLFSSEITSLSQNCMKTGLWKDWAFISTGRPRT